MHLLFKVYCNVGSCGCPWRVRSILTIIMFCYFFFYPSLLRFTKIVIAYFIITVFTITLVGIIVYYRQRRWLFMGEIGELTCGGTAREQTFPRLVFIAPFDKDDLFIYHDIQHYIILVLIYWCKCKHLTAWKVTRKSNCYVLFYVLF